MIERSKEFELYMETAAALPSNALTACPGRTVHGLLCHMAASVIEMDRHIVAYLDSSPLTRTRLFEEREEPMLPLGVPRLVELTLDAEETFRANLSKLLDTDPDATLYWTGRTVPAKGFITHIRNECAVHRWDMVGDDELSHELLGQPDLLAHDRL